MSKSTTTFTTYIILLVLSLGSCCTKGDQYPPPPKIDEQRPFIDNKQGSFIDNKQGPGADKKVIQTYIARFGQPQVTFQEDDEGLHVIIDTKRLRITSVSKHEVEDYQNYLFGVAKVMEKYATGKTKDKAYTEQRIAAWVDRWREKNPFAGLVVRLKPQGYQAEGEFLGHVVLGGGDELNSSELAYMIRADRWRQGYGSEAMGAAVLFFAPEMAQRGYKLPNKEPFERIIATSRKDNTASVRILNKLGFSVYKQTDKYGHTRDHYELAVKL